MSVDFYRVIPASRWLLVVQAVSTTPGGRKKGDDHWGEWLERGFQTWWDRDSAEFWYESLNSEKTRVMFQRLFVASEVARHETLLQSLGKKDYVLACVERDDEVSILNENFIEQLWKQAFDAIYAEIDFLIEIRKKSKVEIELIRDEGVPSYGFKVFPVSVKLV